MAETWRRNKPMSDDELIAYCERLAENALNRSDEELSERRQTLLDYYMGETYGNEREGRSQVRTRETLEVVEWAVAGLMRIFYGIAPVCEFPPIGAEDEEAAAQESDVVSHLIMHRNPGWSLLRGWFKDACLYPTAYAKVYWDDSAEPITTLYAGLSAEEAILLLPAVDEDPDAELAEWTENDDGTLDIAVNRRRMRHKLVVKPVPPEEVLVDSNATDLDLDGCAFVCHNGMPTRSELVSQGYDPDDVWRLPDANEIMLSTERESRRDTTDEDTVAQDGTGAQMRVECREAYVRVDYDGDGISELRKVVWGGGVLLENTPTDEQPIIALSALPQTHRHVGLSLAEIAQPLQLINSTLVRQLLDNMYRVNGPRIYHGPGVNVGQLQDYTPDGTVEMEDVGQAKPEVVPVFVKEILGVLEFMENELGGRTGVSKQLTALDPDVLAKTTVGAYMSSLGQASQRLEMLAREFAESGVKKLCLKVHHLMRKHAREMREASVKLRGKYVPVEPQAWLERADMDVRVGLGTGNVQERLSSAMSILEMQRESMQVGLANPKRLYNALSDFVEAMGKHNVNRYFVDPESEEFAAWSKQQAEQAQAAQQAEQGMLGAQAELADKALLLEQMKARLKHAEEAAKIDRDYAKMELEHEVDIQGVGLEAENVRPLSDAAD